jgi:hypothetical protein
MFGVVGHLYHDAPGNRLIIADFGAHLVRSLNLLTNAVTTIAGNVTRSINAEGDGNPNLGNADGASAQATFDAPYGVAQLGPGLILVSDFGNNALRVLDSGAVSAVFTVAGAADPFGGDFVDGDGAAARFWDPSGMATAPDGSVIVADAVNGAIRRLTCGFVPSASPAPAAPAAAPASDNILGPVVVGGLRSGALALILAGVLVALAGAAALWWYLGGGAALSKAPPAPSAELPASPRAYDALSPGASAADKAVANPLAAAGAGAAAAASAPALPGGVQEWNGSAQPRV